MLSMNGVFGLSPYGFIIYGMPFGAGTNPPTPPAPIVPQGGAGEGEDDRRRKYLNYLAKKRKLLRAYKLAERKKEPNIKLLEAVRPYTNTEHYEDIPALEDVNFYELFKNELATIELASILNNIHEEIRESIVKKNTDKVIAQRIQEQIAIDLAERKRIFEDEEDSNLLLMVGAFL